MIAFIFDWSRMNFWLYSITNTINGKQYIGVSRCPKKRRAAHFAPTQKAGSKLIKAAILKYGRENFSFVLLVNGDKDYIFDLEIKAIGRFKTLAPYGYNLTNGGERSLDGYWIGRKLSEETKAKISMAKKGKVLWPNGRVFDADFGAKISAALKGKPRKRRSDKGKPRTRRSVRLNE